MATEETTMAVAALAVGERVQDADGARGTMRYVGPVATSKDAAAVYYGAWVIPPGYAEKGGGVHTSDRCRRLQASSGTRGAAG
jgi:hypothetical protein